jgi:hypothetical protein
MREQKQRADLEEVKQATGAPDFRVEILPSTQYNQEYEYTESCDEYYEGCKRNVIKNKMHGHPAAVQLTNLGAAIIVEKVILNGRPECSIPLQKFVSKTGDVLSIIPLCGATVTVSIETNRGTVNYKVQ